MVPVRPSLDHSFIIQDFMAFYGEVISARERALSGELPLAQRLELPLSADMTGPLVEYLSNTLTSRLESQMAAAVQMGGDLAASIYQEAQYIMAALGDEVFLTLEWPGRILWESYLLEQRLFDTQVAGTKFYENLDAFLTHRDPYRVNLGALYFFALALGFRGQYIDENDHGTIQRYKSVLFDYVYGQPPALLQGKRLLCPEAYSFTQTGGTLRFLPSPRTWYLYFGMMVIAFFIGSSALWYATTSSLSDALTAARASGLNTDG